MNEQKWRTDGVRVVRAQELTQARGANGGRATVFDFAGSGGTATWIGSVTLPPLVKTGKHHHGRHEVMLHVVKGRTEVRWGESLEFVAMVMPGDYAYFTPFVPHQEFNPDPNEPAELIVVRSDNERIAIKLDGDIAEKPETVY
jgi:uncharacterized RmlC-like cupin family protein